MSALIAKTKGKVVPFEKGDKCSQVFYEELARMPVVGSAIKIISLRRCYRSFLTPGYRLKSSKH